MRVFKGFDNIHIAKKNDKFEITLKNSCLFNVVHKMSKSTHKHLLIVNCIANPGSLGRHRETQMPILQVSVPGALHNYTVLHRYYESSRVLEF